jgi:hypothetical protein
MLDSERPGFASRLAAVAAYYRVEISPAEFGIYWSGLTAYSLEAIAHAMSLHVRDPDRGRFMPKVADLVRFAREHPGAVCGKPSETVLRSWLVAEERARTRLGLPAMSDIERAALRTALANPGSTALPSIEHQRE